MKSAQAKIPTQERERRVMCGESQVTPVVNKGTLYT